ncbi:MAG: primosomal protein N' [Lachnospiraceae bacterium]|nr:primosomal protein N' [Lachnospiraceae bacterium]
MSKFADVIVDISHEKVDRPFEYIIPTGLEDQISVGSQVYIPFGRGNKKIAGFVIGIKEQSAFDPNRMKAIDSLVEHATSTDGEMIALAYFIKTNYGSTMNQALRTVLPVKKSAAPIQEKYISLTADEQTLSDAIEKYGKDRRSVAKLRLLTELAQEKVLPYEIVRDKLNIAKTTLTALEKEQLIRIDVRENLRDALGIKEKQEYTITLNPEQQQVSEDIWRRYQAGDNRPSLIRGITGSGKTEIYIDIIDKVIKENKQAIVLIPEIALTFQTVLRFYKKFGDRISVIHSKLTQAQKHDQLEKAKNGQVDIIIGPRSALFSPFPNLGVIIIDEEHEGTYKNENVPRYISREVAIERMRLTGGFVVLGSATPSVESYFKAEQGEYQLYTLEKRATGAMLPEVTTVDLREELNEGNRSIISRKLDAMILDRLAKKEQIILFINRRGYSSFVSCRSCGTAIKCPHCDVSLKYHRNGKLMCHYCGYETPMVKTCPSCGSKYIGTFGTGTQKVEEEINKRYPDAVTLRMDMDTTKQKQGHEQILSAFANQEADILIGTQMIVKGHDFPNVTLVGILAADLSLYASDYMATERTFQLLTQAAGRAGRGSKKGEVIIQTYSPENYAVRLGAKQDYKGFYDFELSYRKLLGYPPVKNMLGILFACEDERHLTQKCNEIGLLIERKIRAKEAASADPVSIQKIGPGDAPIAKINDQYRKVIYLKSEEYQDLTDIKDSIETYLDEHPDKTLSITFDFSMMGSRKG